MNYLLRGTILLFKKTFLGVDKNIMSRVSWIENNQKYSLTNLIILN
jgi:hypothetical protein